ncbi:MAG: diguanylate cyclase [Mycobacteriales bacterium]|nr:diguanylate cyclase [Mycobacteriales bacterium]
MSPGELVARLRELADGRRWLQTVLDHIPAMIGYWDRDLRNRMANRAYQDWFGKMPEQLRGVHISELLGPELFLKNLPYMEKALSGVEQTFDREIVDPTGTVRYSQASYVPDIAESGQVDGFFVLVADITPRVLAEQQLQQEQRRTHRLAEQLTIVSRVSASLHALAPEEIQEAVADAVLALGYAGSSLELLDRDSQAFVTRHGRGLFAALDGQALSMQEGASGDVLTGGGPVVVDDYQDYAKARSVIRDTGVRTTISLPVRTTGDLVALLHAGTTQPAKLSPSDVDVLSLLADIAGTALGNARRLLRAQAATRHYAEQAETDPLTQVGNRRAADLMLAELQPGDVVVVLDLDHFKAVNDTRGHAAGDTTLQQFAHHVRAGLRDLDSVARVGGEEFLLVLAAVDRDEAEAVLGRIKDAWLATAPSTTFSGGVASKRTHEDSADTYARADAALYRAKSSGRNRMEYDA